MAELGIKLADGSFFPIGEDNAPLRKRVILSTASDHQQQVNLTVLRRELDGEVVVGSIVLSDIAPGTDDPAELELVLGLDADGNVDAQLTDPASGQYSSFAINLADLPTEPSFPSFDAGDDFPVHSAEVLTEDESAVEPEDDFGDLGFGNDAGNLEDDGVDLDLDLEEPFDPSADLAAVEHNEELDSELDADFGADLSAESDFGANSSDETDFDVGLGEDLDLPGGLSIDDDEPSLEDPSLEGPSLDDLSLDDLDGLDEPDSDSFKPAVAATGLDSVDDFGSFGESEPSLDDESMGDFDLGDSDAADELDDFSLDSSEVDIDADLGSLDDDLDSDPDISSTPLGGGFGGGMDYRSADEADPYSAVTEDRRPAAKKKSARESVDFARPFRALALVAVLLIGLTLIALATYGVFLLMVSEPVPVLRAFTPLVALPVWPRRPRRFTQR